MKKLIVWGSIIGVIILGALIYYVGKPSPPTTVSVPEGWVTHQDPKGFSVNLPTDWKVRANASNGRIDLVGPEGAQVTIWPIFVPTALDSNSAAAALSRLMAQVWPKAQWEPMQTFSSAAIRQRGATSNREVASILTWINSAKGSAAFLYALAAPTSDYPRWEDTFAAVLESFRIAGSDQEKNQPPPVNYVRFQDPRENAFSFEIPEQWKVSGGLYRFASVDTRGAFVATSPDGAIRVTGGDADLPTFTEPSPVLQMAGFYEGSWYSPGYGVRMMVRRFEPPTEAVKSYIASSVARECKELSYSGVRDRADAVQAINAINARFNNTTVSSARYAGEAAFSCRQNDQELGGYYFVEILRVGTQGGSIWNVEYLYGYKAPRDRQDEAQSVLEHILTTYRLNPQWVQMQQNLAAATSQIVSQTSEQISNMIAQAYEYRSQSQDELSRRRENAILGLEDVVDPISGRQFKIESGSNYQWIDNQGFIVGTQTDTKPGFDFRALVRLP